MGVAVKRDQWQILLMFKHIVRKKSDMKIPSLIKTDFMCNYHVCAFHIFLENFLFIYYIFEIIKNFCMNAFEMFYEKKIRQ